MTEVAPTIDTEALRLAANRACGLLKALSNPDRLLLLCHLSEAEYCVSELELATGISQPTLSQQLTVLRQESLVGTRREGKQIFYRIESPQALAVMQVLYEQFCHAEKGKKQ
jgi:DNA-binding transcriptional ArsR family regulator